MKAETKRGVFRLIDGRLLPNTALPNRAGLITINSCGSTSDRRDAAYRSIIIPAAVLR